MKILHSIAKVHAHGMDFQIKLKRHKFQIHMNTMEHINPTVVLCNVQIYHKTHAIHVHVHVRTGLKY